jgi:hypothetical protein
VRSEPDPPGPPKAAAGALALALWLFGCSSPQSFVVLALQSASPTPLVDVAQLTVVVSRGTTEMKTLSYEASDLTIVADADTSGGTLSVSFSGGETGDITFDVTALDPQGCAIGHGAAIVTIRKGAVNEGIVALTAEQACAADAADAADAETDTASGSGAEFPGCDPARPVCAAKQTCQVECVASKNECVTGGAASAGAACQSNADCPLGTQCFDYTSIGCAAKICLRFCDGDGDCAAVGHGGPGPGSFCIEPVVCAGSPTAYHTCSFNCDPTAAAAAADDVGCPSGLACLMPALDRADCACPEKTRTGREGAGCTSAAGCAPGLICDAQGGALSCRPVCRCDATNGSCATTTNDCPTAGTHCTPVTGQTIYGICR